MIEYRIYRSVYDVMKSHQKRIEFRLLNEKSKSIQIGDIIRFNVVDEDKYLIVKVINKHFFNNIDELWENKEILGDNVLGYTKEEYEQGFYQIFGKEKVICSKIIGIEFEIQEIH